LLHVVTASQTTIPATTRLLLGRCWINTHTFTVHIFQNWWSYNLIQMILVVQVILVIQVVQVIYHNLVVRTV